MNGNGHGLDDALFEGKHDLLISAVHGPELPSIEARDALVGTNIGLPEQDSSAPNVATVFGESYRVGDKTIIPVASVKILRRSSDEGAPHFTQASPVAIIEVDDNGVRINPIVNTSLLVLAGTLLLTWTVYWLLRTLRVRQPQRPL